MGIGTKLAQDFIKQFDNLRATKGNDLEIGDIDGLFKHLKSEEKEKLYEGIQNIANKINMVKVEIFTPSPDEITGEIIPDANLELDAVVKAAEVATNTILDAVEVIQSSIEGIDPEIYQKVLDQVTKIFEACNFQDITGQRISKVVSTLVEIDASVNEILAAISDKVSLETRERPMDDPNKALMSGPQLESDAPSQEEIDRLFAEEF